MMLIGCVECGAKQDYSILERATVCPSCGTGEQALSRVSSDGGTAADGARTVLIVDDEPTMRETYRHWVGDDDRWDVSIVSSGQRAVEDIDEAVDVLVLDRHMPRMSGAEIVDELDRTAFHGEVLVVSACKPDDDLSETEVKGYLTKPVRKETFVEMLGQLATA